MGVRSVSCPDCGEVFQVEERWIPSLGAKVRCESCDQLLWLAPAAEEEDEASPVWQDLSAESQTPGGSGGRETDGEDEEEIPDDPSQAGRRGTASS